MALAQQILSVVVPVGGADHGVDVLAIRQVRIGEVAQIRSTQAA